MSAFLPLPPSGPGPESDDPRLQQRPLSPAERRSRWEVRAAQWRARELAEAVFGEVSAMGVTGIRGHGPLRGLMRLDVPFHDLDVHEARQERFMAAVASDPLLASVRLVYVFGAAAV
ncbi:MAG: hypothetical protein R3253_16255 [Longimicrobiales bacterium]|nr:hypothetical protein [Longimicrobiales bacterium]